MGRRTEDGSRRKGSDKQRERNEKNGKFSNKHIRAQEQVREKAMDIKRKQ